MAVLVFEKGDVVGGERHLAVDGVGSGEGPGEHQTQQVLIAYAFDSQLVLKLLKVKHPLDVVPVPGQSLLFLILLGVSSSSSSHWLERAKFFVGGSISEASQFPLEHCALLLFLRTFVISHLVVAPFFSSSLS